MAFEQSYAHISGMPAPRCYWRALRYAGFNKGEVTVTFIGYLNQAARVADVPPCPGAERTVTFVYDLESEDNLIRQAYLAARQLPEWADAKDV